MSLAIVVWCLRKAQVMSIHDHPTPLSPLGDSGSPYSAGTPLGDSLRWYENRKCEPLIEPAHTSYKGNLPIARIVTMLIIGFWSGIILSIVFSVI